MKRIIMTSTAKMPASVKARYINIAVVELEDGFDGTPKMISERAKGVAKIVKKWTVPEAGKTMRSARMQAMGEAEELIKKENK